MSGIKSKLGLFAMFAAMAAERDAMAAKRDTGYSERSEYRELTDEEKEKLKAIAENKRIERLKKQGVNEYFYGQNVIYARNQKNADRKARNKGYLCPCCGGEANVLMHHNKHTGYLHILKRKKDA